MSGNIWPAGAAGGHWSCMRLVRLCPGISRPLNSHMDRPSFHAETASANALLLMVNAPLVNGILGVGPMSINVCAVKLARLGALALIGTAAVSLSTGSASAETGLGVLAGTWHGSGTMSFESGEAESISCNGYYKGAGNLSVVIRCKGASSNFELRSKLDSNGEKVSGSWEERTYNATGDVSGTVTDGKLKVQFSGSLTGSLEMSFSPSNQSISVLVGTKGAGIKGVNVSLSRM
jgi:hypothetical protein